MKEKGKNKNDNLSDFTRYIRGEMTRREENAFQRKLQKDPFAAEATEGLSQITPREANVDMNRLRKKLNFRIWGNQRPVYYRIAASLAVLLVISSVFIIVVKNMPVRQLSKSPAIPAQSEKITGSDLSPVPSVAEVETITTKPENDTEKGILTDKIEAITPAETENSSLAKETETIAMIEKKDTIINIAEVQMAAPDEAKSVMDVAGYGATKSARANIADTTNNNKNIQAAYSPPAPVNGRASFDKYIENNIRKPATLTDEEKAVVVLSFRVQSSGIIDSLKVISSPGIEFSDEAIRLIKEGPSWNPAEVNQIKIDEEVRIKIEFQ